jgi:hypothetical protein
MYMQIFILYAPFVFHRWQKSGANRAVFGHSSMWLVGAAAGPRLYSYQYRRGPGLRKESFTNAQPSEDHAIPSYLQFDDDDRHQRIPDPYCFGQMCWHSLGRSRATPLNLRPLKGQHRRKERGYVKVEEM